MKQLHINCLQCDNEFYEDWDRILNYRGIRPGQDFGIDKVRFYALPTVFCNYCHSVCELELIEVITETKKQIKRIALLQTYQQRR